MSKQTDAIRLYFESQGIKIKDVATALNLSSPAVSNMLAGRDKIGKNRAQQLHDVYGFNYIFLVTGEGSLFGPDPVSQTVNVETNSGTINQKVSRCPDASELLKRIEELTAELENKQRENEWLRSLVDRLAPEGGK